MYPRRDVYCPDEGAVKLVVFQNMSTERAAHGVLVYHPAAIVTTHTLSLHKPCISTEDTEPEAKDLFAFFLCFSDRLSATDASARLAGHVDGRWVRTVGTRLRRGHRRGDSNEGPSLFLAVFPFQKMIDFARQAWTKHCGSVSLFLEVALKLRRCKRYSCRSRSCEAAGAKTRCPCCADKRRALDDSCVSWWGQRIFGSWWWFWVVYIDS